MTNATCRILSTVMVGLFLLGSSVAQADVFVFATIDKTKFKTHNETVSVFKDVQLFVIEDIFVDGVSEQEVIKNQRNQFNFVEDETTFSSASILDGSAATANGIVLINQSPGFANNQGNEVSVTFGNAGIEGDGVFAHAQAAVQQINGSDGGEGFNEYIAVLGGSIYEDTIGAPGGTDGPFSNGSGVVGVNQSAGSLNNQNNAMAVALADNAVFALGEADLGQFNTFNFVDVVDQVRTDTVAGGALAGFNGVAMINQSAGAVNNQANVLDIAATATATLPFTLQEF